jgi:hypothetical protein
MKYVLAAMMLLLVGCRSNVSNVQVKSGELMCLGHQGVKVHHVELYDENYAVTCNDGTFITGKTTVND